MSEYNVAVQDNSKKEMFEGWAGDNTIAQIVAAAQAEGVGAGIGDDDMGIQIENGTSSDKAVHEFSAIAEDTLSDHCNADGTILILQGDTKVGSPRS